ncbi:MAG TPA: aspartate dehydrogenase, partial [Burkholderiales bacterium]|nr:aspartate dehydrogenase [Burkholderiales bacterium]
MKLGLIGFGGIGSIVAGQLATDAAIEFVGVAARPSQGERIRKVLGAVPVVESPQALLKLKPELVVECASHEAFRQYAEPVLSAGIDLIAVSVGVLA